MFKVFKEKKFKKELELFDFHKSFDIEYSENYQLDSKETSPLKTNTYVFSAHSFEKRQTIYIRLAINPVQTDTTDADFEFDNENAIIVNFKKKKTE